MVYHWVEYLLNVLVTFLWGLMTAIVGISRSRSPSPVGPRQRQSQRGSFMSISPDPETEAGPAAFGADGRPRRGSSRRSAELLDPERLLHFPNREDGRSSGTPEESLPKPPAERSRNFLQVEPGPQQLVQLNECSRGSLPGTRPDHDRRDSDSGKPSSEETLSTISSTEGGGGKGSTLQLPSITHEPVCAESVEDGKGFQPAETRPEAALRDVAVDVRRPSRSRLRSTLSKSPGGQRGKELVSPSEFKNTPKDEMSNLASGSRRSYGSLDDVMCVGVINGDNPRASADTVASEEFTVNNQEQTSRSLSHQSTSFEPKETLPRSSSYTPGMVDELRKRNRLYFMDPITKLFHFHGFPWKLSLQIAKIVVITVQIIMFGGQRQSIVQFFERSNLAFKHLLLLDWDVAYETMPYPPASGPYALYSISHLYDHMNHAMEQYHRLPAESLAAVELHRDESDMPYPIELCFTANDIEVFPNHTYIVHSGVIENCTHVHPENGTIGHFSYDIEKFLRDRDIPLVFNRTLKMVLKMYVHTFHLNLLETRYGPTCYNDSVKIIYSNDERSGQILVSLESLPKEVDCKSQILSDAAAAETKEVKVHMIILDAIAIGVCCLSSMLCARSLKRSNELRQDTARYFKQQRKPLSLGEQIVYINMWYVIIICNDILTIVGSAFKIQLESRIFSISSANYELCSMLLGLGVLLTYVGILRYLGFFKSYNVLILTLTTSFPHVLRFLVCAICLYTGFLFCGWAIFSPYNLKFRTLSSASECLFSLVNGDDMFVTFSALTNSSDAIWYVNRAYLYIFIALFIYVVISVFIAVIMDNYENLKNYYEGNRTDTVIQEFIKEDGEMPLKEIFSHVKGGSCQYWFFCIFPCLNCFRKRFFADDGYTRCNLTNSYPESGRGGHMEQATRPNSDYLTQDVF